MAGDLPAFVTSSSTAVAAPSFKIFSATVAFPMMFVASNLSMPSGWSRRSVAGKGPWNAAGLPARASNGASIPTSSFASSRSLLASASLLLNPALA